MMPLELPPLRRRLASRDVERSCQFLRVELEVHFGVGRQQWREITGEEPPTKPPTAADYTKAGLPWFDYYAADLETLGGAQALALVKSMAEMAAEKGEQVLGPDGEVNPGTIISIGPGETAHAKAPPREGER